MLVSDWIKIRQDGSLCRMSLIREILVIPNDKDWCSLVCFADDTSTKSDISVLVLLMALEEDCI